MTITGCLNKRLGLALSIFATLGILLGCSEKQSQGAGNMPVAIAKAHTYQKDRLALQLPQGWQVFEDFYPVDGRRRLNVVTPIGSSMTLDIFSAEQAPTLGEHFANYMAAILPPETESSSRIDSGDVSYGAVKGMFANVILDEPYDIAMFVEILPLRNGDKQAYFIFNTPPPQKGDISRYIEDIIDTAQLP
ncbi:MAG TPA: hypothetical protein VIC26_00935 [Marinagarivorans sp.]